MIRTPLRPLARVLKARERGEDPQAIEAENLRQVRAKVMEIIAVDEFDSEALRLGVRRDEDQDLPRSNAA